MSVKTSVSSTAQSLSTHPGMLSGPGALRALILLRISSRCPGTASSPGRREEVSLLCSGAVCASKRAKKAFSSFSRGMVLSQVCGGACSP